MKFDKLLLVASLTLSTGSAFAQTSVTKEGEVEILRNRNEMTGVIGTADWSAFCATGNSYAYSDLGLVLRFPMDFPFLANTLLGLQQRSCENDEQEVRREYGFPLGGGVAVAPSMEGCFVGSFDRPVDQIGLTQSGRFQQYFTAWNRAFEVIGQVGVEHSRNTGSFVGLKTNEPIYAFSYCNDDIWNGEELTRNGSTPKTDTLVWANSACGNGRLDGQEECDDGNPVDTDACRNNCQRARCGDEVVRTDLEPGESGYEACEDGNADNTDACLNTCLFASCGDGFLRTDVNMSDGSYEECDDGNALDTDACVASCKAAVCGDGFVQEGVEACDEAAMNSDAPGALCNLDCQNDEMPPVMGSTTSTQASRPRGTTNRGSGGCDCQTSLHSATSHEVTLAMMLLLGLILKRRRN